MKKTVLSAMLLTSLSGISATSQADALAAENFSANVALTTNYIFRGVSLSGDHGAVSGGFDWGYEGFYVGTWASSIDAVETEAYEIDYYAGYAGESGALAYSIDFLYYDYPGEQDGATPDLEYYEFGGSLAYSFDGDMAPTVGVSVLHSPDFYAETGSATAYELFADFALPADHALGIYVGEQDLDADQNAGISSYSYYGINLTKTIGNFDFTLGYSDTDNDGEEWAGDNNGDFVFTVAASI